MSKNSKKKIPKTPTWSGEAIREELLKICQNDSERYIFLELFFVLQESARQQKPIDIKGLTRDREEKKKLQKKIKENAITREQYYLLSKNLGEDFVKKIMEWRHIGRNSIFFLNPDTLEEVGISSRSVANKGLLAKNHRAQQSSSKSKQAKKRDKYSISEEVKKKIEEEYNKNTKEILAGEKFASQKPSDFKRGRRNQTKWTNGWGMIP